jgi:hypothetical protein
MCILWYNNGVSYKIKFYINVCVFADYCNTMCCYIDKLIVISLIYHLLLYTKYKPDHNRNMN